MLAVCDCRTSSAQRGNGKPLTAEQVRRAIKLGVGFLASKQTDSGSWPDAKNQMEGGISCLTTLALINSGWSIEAPAARKAFDYILGLPRESTYVVSLRVMALSAADPKADRFRATVVGDLEWLVEGQLKDGGWGYGDRGSGDGSNSQFALLALNEASRYDFVVKRRNWLKAKSYWERMNSRDGGFAYQSGGATTGSMTCAGIASFTIIRENLFDINKQADGGKAKCCNNAADEIQNRIDRGFEWLAARFTVRGNPSGRMRQSRNRYYYLYALERTGRFAGRRFIGPHDWYRAGAKELVRSQKGAKWLDSTAANFGEQNELVTTSFALLFLSKGRRPVVLGKYDHGAADYDLHPRGIHYLTREIEGDWNAKLNWQTVRAKGADVNDLFESPVLFMSGREAIGLSGEEKKVLKDYIENGGFLFAEACQGNGCGPAAMDAAFRELMIELFPDSQLEPLAPDHPVWNAQYKIGPSKEWPLLGLQACCRTSVVYCPANLSCYWSLSRPGVKNDENVNPQLLKRIEYCKRVGVNVVSYATGRQLDDKLGTKVVDDKAVSVLTDRALVLPKLSHNGGDDDAPNAWGKVLKELAKSEGLEVKTEKTMIGPVEKSLADHPFIFLHGRNKISFTPEQRKAIRNYLEMGGFIFADSICASDAFTKSFRLEIKQIIGEELSSIPVEHELWSDPRYGEPIRNLKLRLKNRDAPGGFDPAKPVPPKFFEGIEFKGRLAIVFSPYDLSCALENKSVSNCSGYVREDAMKIGRKIVLYSLLSDSIPGD
jgi:hypothetical protein